MRWRKRGIWHGFLTWHAEMSPSQEVWRNCVQYAEVRADLAYVFFQVTSIISHSLQTHGLISDATIPLLSHQFIWIVLYGTLS